MIQFVLTFIFISLEFVRLFAKAGIVRRSAAPKPPEPAVLSVGIAV